MRNKTLDALMRRLVRIRKRIHLHRHVVVEPVETARPWAENEPMTAAETYHAAGVILGALAFAVAHISMVAGWTLFTLSMTMCAMNWVPEGHPIRYICLYTLAFIGVLMATGMTQTEIFIGLGQYLIGGCVTAAIASFIRPLVMRRAEVLAVIVVESNPHEY